MEVWRRRSGWRWFVFEKVLKLRQEEEWSAAVSSWIGSGQASAFLNLNPSLLLGLKRLLGLDT